MSARTVGARRQHYVWCQATLGGHRANQSNRVRSSVVDAEWMGGVQAIINRSSKMHDGKGAASITRHTLDNEQGVG